MFGGSGENPVVLPKPGGTGPPTRVPDQPPSKSRLFWEKVVKWLGIAFAAISLVLFVYLAINGFEDEMTDAQIAQTRVAREVTRDASR
jgi:hypothetical protein